ncbi:nucleoside hydrolase [Helcobacillus sp. ACRRO]|uniref:nucleoside hydrolase n=1 Tax=Helcobacillus sp. ACRRO TaxID=2918202 RepID=UPI001EF43A6A|nr:nucleoside hydrolase [Helcobacillus sp. ACRRO]MCG7428112.1 nucleoside hydrolase [Helcobacillus sp. ACRRO]
MTDRTTSIPLFVDCDPGIDDALALAHILCQDDVTITGIAASGGNVSTVQVAANTRGWLALAGRTDVPVHTGHALPLAWHHGPPAFAAGRTEPEYADLTHGPTGAGYAQLPDVPVGPSTGDGEPAADGRDAARAWVEAARAHPGELIGVLLGPATNLALALELEPELPRLLKRLFIMGGAFNYRGNTHPTTEWNVTFDPEATAAVIRAFGGAHLSGHTPHAPVIAPIEATEAVVMAPARLQAILDGAAAYGHDLATGWGAVLNQLGEALRFYFEFHEWDGLGCLAHTHDPFVLACAVDWARNPSAGLPWAETAMAPVDVECAGTLTRGETVADWLGRWGREPNAELIRTIDADAFLQTLSATLMKGPRP